MGNPARFINDRLQRSLPVIIGYLPGPYPDEESLRRGLQILKHASIPCVEIGIPDEAPELEGPVIATAMQALRQDGWDPFRAIAAAGAAARSAGVAGIAVVYVGTMQRFGEKRVISAIAESGLGGVLVPGAGGELRSRVCRECAAYGLDSVAFVPAEAPRPFPEEVCGSDALLYLQTVSGPTGSSFLPDEALAQRVEAARRLQAARGPGSAGSVQPLPVALGFGIKNRHDVEQALALGADVAVIGTAVAEAYMHGLSSLESYLAQFAPLLAGGESADSERIRRERGE